MPKSSPLPRPLLTAACLLSIALTTLSHAQDQIVLENGNQQSGTIVGIRNENLLFKSGPVETTIPLSSIKSVTKAPPSAYEASLAAWAEGNAQAALDQLRPLVTNFEGLPTQWAQRATALLGEIQLSQGQIDQAEKTLESFQESYPDATQLAAASLARVAVEKGDLEKARENVAPLIEKSTETLYIEPVDAPSFAQAHYVMGRVLESEGNHPEALENYITAYAIYHHDPSIARLAAERAKNLEADKSVVVP